MEVLFPGETTGRIRRKIFLAMCFCASIRLTGRRDSTNMVWWRPFSPVPYFPGRYFSIIMFSRIIQATRQLIHVPGIRSGLSRIILSIIFCLWANSAVAHGGVAFEEDLCLISIDFLQAHFTVYQPQTRSNREYCEDIPDVARAVFVMEYLHGFLQEMPVDFRIVRDINEVGKYAKWEDLEAITDLEAATVYYDPPRIEPGGYYTASYTFEEKGTYIGVVTAQHPTTDRVYNAVFYFQVGGADWGTMPFFVILLILLQTGYWLSSGGLARLRQ